MLFAGLTAFDTQKIKSMYYAGDNKDVAAKKSIHGALTLYLDFINMYFTYLSSITIFNDQREKN